MAGPTPPPAFRLFHSLRFPLVAVACGIALASLASAQIHVPGTTPAAAAPSTPTSQPATRTAEQKKKDDINRVMEFLRITQPDVYDRAVVLRDTDPEKFEKLISGASSTVNRLESTRRRNPRLFELSMQDLKMNYQTLRIAHQLQDPALPNKLRLDLTAQIKKLVADEFDVQQEIRRLEIEDLKRKIGDLETRVCDREQDKPTIIGKRIQDLTVNPKLEW